MRPGFPPAPVRPSANYRGAMSGPQNSARHSPASILGVFRCSRFSTICCLPLICREDKNRPSWLKYMRPPTTAAPCIRLAEAWAHFMTDDTQRALLAMPSLPFLSAGLTAPLSLWQAVQYIMCWLQFDADKAPSSSLGGVKRVHFATSKFTICWPAVNRGQHQDWLRKAYFLVSLSKQSAVDG